MKYKSTCILSRTPSHGQTFEKLDKLKSRRVKRIYRLEKEKGGISLNSISRIVKKNSEGDVCRPVDLRTVFKINHRSPTLSLLVPWVVYMSVLYTVMFSCESY